MEGNLAFTAPTVDQFRNPHTLLKDFIDEDDLYKKAGSLVDFLIAWRPSAGASLPAMMVELAQVCNWRTCTKEADLGHGKLSTHFVRSCCICRCTTTGKWCARRLPVIAASRMVFTLL